MSDALLSDMVFVGGLIVIMLLQDRLYRSQQKMIRIQARYIAYLKRKLAWLED
jgi:hypothetical protein